MKLATADCFKTSSKATTMETRQDAFAYLEGPLCMVALDPKNLHPIQVNNMFKRYMGSLFKFAEYEFVSAASDYEDCTDQQRLREAIDSVALGKTDRARVRNVEMTTLIGDSVPIRKHFDWFVGKGRVDNGNIIGAPIILMGDPCSEVDTEEREKDAELIDFFQNAPIALHWLNNEGIVIWANQTELNMLGYTAEEYIGQPIMRFCPDEEELVLETLKQLGSGNTIRDVPVRFRTKEGKIVYLLIDSNVRYNKGGSFGHTRCFIRDDTGRKIREARASLLLQETKRSLCMLDNFMGRTLHHLRTPLHVTQNMCDALSFLVRKSLATPEIAECNDLIKMTTDQIARSVDLINDISDLAKFDQGSVLHCKSDVLDIEEMGRDVLQNTPRAAPGVNVILELGPSQVCPTTENGPACVASDGDCLVRVLGHLLANAIDATEKGSVTLNISYKHGRLTFTTIDTGKGLEFAEGASEGNLPAIFQRYHQQLLPEDTIDFDEATTLRDRIEHGIQSHQKNGLGIGLSLSYYLVQALGGELKCQSKLNEGTKMWFSLPFTATRSSAIPEVPQLANIRIPKVALNPSFVSIGSLTGNIPKVDAEKQSGTLTSPKKRKIGPQFNEPLDVFSKTPFEKIAVCGVAAESPPSILIVEDTMTCAKMLSMTLSKFNCSTKVAENGQIAVDILKNAPSGLFDLVLMDLRMPVMDGLTATRIIKNELKLRIPIVALTGDANECTRKQCDIIGFDDFQTKPMKRQDLKELIYKYTGYQII